MHRKHHDQPRPVPQPRLSAQCCYYVINFLPIELACEKMGSVVCTLFIVNWFSLKSVAIRKRRNILPCIGGDGGKSAIAQDAGVARYFDHNVFKAEPESERPVSFILTGNDGARRVKIAKAARLRDRGVGPQKDEHP
jgi:hypothetical protein